MDFSAINDGVLAAIVASAIGGLVGAMIVGARAQFGISGLVGVITGLSLATVLRLLDVDPIFGIDGFSMLYAALGGAASSWIVGRSS